jgi:hypothetical protein
MVVVLHGGKVESYQMIIFLWNYSSRGCNCNKIDEDRCNFGHPYDFTGLF